MKTKTKMKKIISLFVLALLVIATIFASQVIADDPEGKYYRVRTITLADGTSIDEIIINGPPTPPPGYERTTVDLPEPNPAKGVNVLTNVPAFDWSFGCSATSAAMIAGYYDRISYANMYTGPTNGGVMPLDNSSWPDWIDSHGDTRHQCPLSATHNGLDGRATYGHVDDYWIYYDQPGPDPWVGNWAEHAYGDCTGDYMKTNQWVNLAEGFNVDGATTFYNYTDGSPLPWNDMEGYGIDIYDGGYGVKLFYESRGYTVTDMYNQYIQGQGSNPALGFTYAQYKAEIDAGRPVMFHVTGHTMIGLGYDDATNLMYIHDTWDYSTYTMTWGGTYHGMQHKSVTIVQLAAAATGTLEGTVTDADTTDPIASAQVDADGNTTLTNASGFYQFPSLPVGTYSMTVSAYGYAPSTVSGVSVTDGITTTQDFALTPFQMVYLPLVMKNYSPPVTIMSEDFEGTWPGSWDLWEGGTGDYKWKQRNCRAYGGSYSGWGVGGGADGSLLACGSNYPNNANSWMIYGPFSLADATAADLQFKLWLDTQLTYDAVCRMASTNGTNFSGWCVSGNTGGWDDYVLDLAGYTGESQVWVALIFGSDSSINIPEGGYVDNILLRKCTLPSCPGIGSQVEPIPEGAQMVETPATFVLNR